MNTTFTRLGAQRILLIVLDLRFFVSLRVCIFCQATKLFAQSSKGENWIVTNSHVVADASFVQVRRFGDARKFSAHIKHQSHQCDLAILSVEDSSFWEDLPALTIEPELPELQAEVVCIGFPTGGDGIS